MAGDVSSFEFIFFDSLDVESDVVSWTSLIDLCVVCFNAVNCGLFVAWFED